MDNATERVLDALDGSRERVTAKELMEFTGLTLGQVRRSLRLLSEEGLAEHIGHRPQLWSGCREIQLTLLDDCPWYPSQRGG